MAVGDLITQAEYQTATSTPADARVPLAIEGASSAIRSYTQRALGLPIQTEERTFDYDGSGVVEIDDVVNVTAVVVGASTLAPASYILRPRSAPENGYPYFWLEITPAPGGSPEMGFTSNLDRFPFRALSTPLTVKVTGDFGWPTPPDFVKQATVWTVDEWLRDISGGGESGPLSGESIADFSQSWAVAARATAGTGVLSALPERARDVLDPISREAF